MVLLRRLFSSVECGNSYMSMITTEIPLRICRSAPDPSEDAVTSVGFIMPNTSLKQSINFLSAYSVFGSVLGTSHSPQGAHILLGEMDNHN